MGGPGRIGAGVGVQRVGPVLIGLGAVVAAGLAVIGLAWSKAAGTDLVAFQVPALVAVMVGSALAGLALAAYDVHLGRRSDALESQAWEALMGQVTDVARAAVGSVDGGGR